MRMVLTVVGLVLVLLGIIWFLQGINVLPGSFMTGQVKWAVNGCVAAVAGLIVLFFNSRRASK